MTAMASCVKGLAVPGPAPGPWAANAALVQIRAADTDVTARTVRDVMTISCDEEVLQDTDDSRYGFENLVMRMSSREENLARLRSSLWRNHSQLIQLACCRLWSALRRGVR
jgi:hypothetical protein